MKFNDLQKMPKEELDKKIVDMRLELMKISAQVAIGTTPKNTKQIRDLKRTLAKVETLKKQKFEDNLKNLLAEKDAATAVGKKTKKVLKSTKTHTKKHIKANSVKRRHAKSSTKKYRSL